ncbi:hypothetical protein BH18GEM1_BH18GEM1_03470 [soil metagenome]
MPEYPYGTRRGTVVGSIVARSKQYLVVFALSASLLTVAFFALPVSEWMTALLKWTAGRGPWTAVLLGALWIPAALLLVPGSLLTLGTGFLLGVVWGVVTVSIASTLGAAAAFMVGRTFGREWVSRRVERRPRFRAVNHAVGREGFKLVFLTRLSPLFPYNFLNYAYGLTGVPFRDFLLGSWLGMLPGTILYVYLGSGARTLAGLAAGSGDRSPAELALFAAGLVAAVAAAFLVTGGARRALSERDTGEETTSVPALAPGDEPETGG